LIKSDKKRRQENSLPTAKIAYQIYQRNQAEVDEKSRVNLPFDDFTLYKFEIFKECNAISWQCVDIFVELNKEGILPEFVVAELNKDSDFNNALEEYYATGN
jgi:hypothetical protein